MQIKTTILTVILFWLLHPVCAQSCTEKLSLAEQDYRDGKLQDVKSKLCKCFGIYVDSKNKIRPVNFQSMIEEMQRADSLYASELGPFKYYWRSLILSRGEVRKHADLFFTLSERYRAYVLLGKLYLHLGVVPLSEFFALKAVSVDPDKELKSDSTSFGRVYAKQTKRVRQLTFGPVAGLHYTIPTAVKYNRPGVTEFKYQSDGKVLLGANVSYYFNPKLILSANFLWNSLKVVYLQPDKNYLNYSFYHLEKQNWYKLPLLLKWQVVNLYREKELKLFMASGFSLDYLARSEVTISDVQQDNYIYDFRTTSTRNRWNAEFVLQLLVRFKAGQNYLNLGFTGSRTLRYTLDESQIGSPSNRLFNATGLVEDNYKMWQGFWLISYDFRFSKIKSK
jgi:hypothetical protein